ncbi:Oxidoreductase aflX [Fulvia fulva]|uniref:Oxidoreductase aflX n=1 Tax=Passalora fulva TaxID=5499 RepID=A0A9Q8URT7_PASFU|nr:Oxidoreductase aflX [Fulvia fulva]KAK4620149.1 Oxidoreductase aflX [Fulvia fulva]KAK4621157.1 Oxidoreductase aflX [Fulvia fulva]UJO20078.1 Oxidoreductase aflX [Fulvia fulva]WPV17644.1 Oxidoreductase aflX [Fulvia fulva]WPV32664.1 Oxidoreductase aflX [Fulvia fulva]
MPSYAILGATGNIGRSILEVLLQSPDNHINAYCRFKQKLYKLMPVVKHNKQVDVFEGELSDINLLARCLIGTTAAFQAVAVDGNQPGCTIAQDTSRRVTTALEHLKANGHRLPKLVVTSSSSTDHSLLSNVPSFFRNMLYRAFSHTYDDLLAAEKFIRSKDDLISATFVKPGALTSQPQVGHELSLEVAKSPLSYLDLAAGMIELADDSSERYDMKGVAVNSAVKVPFPRESPMKIFKGLLCHFFPWLYPYIG